MEMVKVRMRKPRRVHIFLSDGIPVKRDEACIVRTDRGLEWGTCILPPEPCPREMEKRYSSRVVRCADEGDYKTQDHLVVEEKRAMEACAKKIESHRMPMKLVDAEYTFDKQKFIFYFTADDRVDFRELVRDLAHDLRSRIELRHIQVRDEAKMVGGIGMCGRQLCCTTFLDDFKPISMRMAKRQNLSLNPSKISGQCGRLLCCLEYENDQYGEAKRRAKREQEPRQEEQEVRPASKWIEADNKDEWVDRPKPENRNRDDRDRSRDRDRNRDSVRGRGPDQRQDRRPPRQDARRHDVPDHKSPAQQTSPQPAQDKPDQSQAPNPVEQSNAEKSQQAQQDNKSRRRRGGRRRNKR